MGILLPKGRWYLVGWTIRYCRDVGWCGQTGRDCYDAILAKDAAALGRSMNECMVCWEAILPRTVYDTSISLDLMEILAFYQKRYFGAMYSGCGGGYIYVVSEEAVPGGFQVKIRVS